MRQALFLFSVLLSGFGQASWENPCGPFEPGHKLTFDAYQEKVSALSINFSPISPWAYRAFNVAIDPEVLPALRDIFSNAKDAKTQILYGSFGRTKDGADGFRVIWMRTISDRAKARRFVSVITFWTWKNGQPVLIGGPDGLRVRFQIEAESERYKAGRYAGASYELKLDANGQIISLEPGYYLEEVDTGLPNPRSAGFPSSCVTCHGREAQSGQIHHVPNNPSKNGVSMAMDLRDFQTDEDALTPANVKSIQPFLNKLTETQRSQALVDSFRKPRTTFFPPGIVTAVEARCRALELAK